MKELLLILATIFCTSVLSYLYGHEFGIVEGQRMQKEASQNKLNQCHRIIAKEVFE